MNYHWLDCSDCRCHVAVNWTVTADRLSGSVRRWAPDRSINDGKAFSLPRGEDPGAPAAGAIAACVCGAPIPLPARPDAVGGERTDDLRVTLTSGD
jgi:hypothetical protein